MSIHVGCPHCGARLRVKDEMAGRRGKCPKCSTPVEVPVLAQLIREPEGGAPARQGVGAAPAAHRSAIAKPATASGAEKAAMRSVPLALKKEILAQVAGNIEPVPTSAAYKASVLLVALVMLLLPLVYVSLIAGVCWLIWLHALHNVWMLGEPGVDGARARGLVAFGYLTPLAIGAITVFFMCKPLFARPARRELPRSLSRGGEPLLFEFVDKLCAVVGAPRPKRIDVDCQVNASASFHSGMLSMFGRDMVLTIGLPLAAGLNLREFAGVLAHEFGHFTQGWGMRLSYVIRTISHWFTRVVYERDAWDQWLIAWSSGGDWRVRGVLYIARLFVWATRKALWVLMVAGHAVSGILLRQMEFDADLHEARFSGSDTFASTCRRLPVLNVASSAAFADLEAWYREARLGDDLPRLIVAKVDQLPAELRAAIDEQAAQSKTGWLDTHPADSERIAHAAADMAPGLFRDDRPATALFSDFAALSRTVTFDTYKALLGNALKITDLHPTEQLLARQELENAAGKALDRYFHDAFRILRPLPLASGWIEPPQDAKACKRRLRQVIQQLAAAAESYARALGEFEQLDALGIECAQAAALLDAGFKIKPGSFSQPLGKKNDVDQASRRSLKRQAQLSRSLESFEKLAAERLSSALQLSLVAEVIARIPNGQTLPDRCRDLLSTLLRINRAIPPLIELRNAHAALMVLLENITGNEQNQTLISAIQDRMTPLHRAIGNLKELLVRVEYPFKHGRGKVSVAVYCTETVPAADDLGALLSASGEIFDRLPPLLHRVMGQLALAAENVEKVLGLSPKQAPQTRT